MELKNKFIKRFDDWLGRRYIINDKFELQFYKEYEIGLAVLYDKPSKTLVFHIWDRSFSIQFWYDDFQERMVIIKEQIQEFYDKNPDVDYIPFIELGDLDPAIARQLDKLGLREKGEQKSQSEE